MNKLPFLTPLGREDLAALGLPPEWQFGMSDRVRFSELDAIGHVNHTEYLSWFETMRVAYVRNSGLGLLQEGGPEIVLKGLDMQYHAPMFLDEEYLVTARVMSFRNTSFRMHYAVWAPDCRAEGTALVVQISGKDGGKLPLSDKAKAVLLAQGAQDET